MDNGALGTYVGVFEHMGGIRTYRWVYECIGVYKCMGAYGCPLSLKTCLPLKKSKKILFKAKFLQQMSWKIIIREPPDHTGNEPTLDIPIGGSGQDIKKNKMAKTCHL